MVCLLQRCKKKLALISSCIFINNIPGWVFSPFSVSAGLSCLFIHQECSLTSPAAFLSFFCPEMAFGARLPWGPEDCARVCTAYPEPRGPPRQWEHGGAQGGATAPPRAHVLREAPARPPEPFVALSSVGRGRGSRAF